MPSRMGSWAASKAVLCATMSNQRSGAPFGGVGGGMETLRGQVWRKDTR
jgi:hypothetical protein